MVLVERMVQEVAALGCGVGVLGGAGGVEGEWRVGEVVGGSGVVGTYSCRTERGGERGVAGHPCWRRTRRLCQQLMPMQVRVVREVG